MILINAVRHSATAEPDHAHSDYVLPELHREAAPCVRAAIGAFEVNIGDALPMSGIASERQTIIVHSHFE
jgi:hypothetical protein